MMRERVSVNLPLCWKLSKLMLYCFLDLYFSSINATLILDIFPSYILFIQVSFHVLYQDQFHSFILVYNCSHSVSISSFCHVFPYLDVTLLYVSFFNSNSHFPSLSPIITLFWMFLPHNYFHIHSSYPHLSSLPPPLNYGLDFFYGVFHN